MNNNIYQPHLSGPEHLVVEKSSWDIDFQRINESQFALGNGYLGSRGIHEEHPKGCQPGTYFAGVFDPTASKVSEMVNAPNLFDLRVSIPKDEKIDVSIMEVVSHERILDLRKGLLCRHTVFEDHNKNKYDYQSFRFLSMANPHLAVMQVAVTPLDKGGVFTINSAIDIGVTNHGILKEPDIRHFHISEVTKEKHNINYLAVKTLAHEIVIAYAAHMNVSVRGKEETVARRIHTVNLEKGETVLITKYFAFYTSRDIDKEQIKSKTIRTLRQAAKAGINKLLDAHVKAFEKRWSYCDVLIEGDANAQSALRFNIYHLLIATHPEVRNVSVGAKTISGEGYRGHVFWETDVLIQPFFIFNEPKTARNFLEYRFNRIKLAKGLARSRGYKGAMFPWESAETGLDDTPLWGKGFDGMIHLIYTGKQEQHITADVFYGMYTYYVATHDMDFMLDMGIELAVESARFWASRLEYNKKTKYYEINGVMGPDEFHDNVNNSAYTNAMAAWNLRTATRLINSLQKQLPRKVNKILKATKWTVSEGKEWERLSKKIIISFDQKTGLITPFDNYFSLKKLPRPKCNEYGLPSFPKDVEIKCLYQTQFIKQADVIMLIHLLPQLFDKKIAVTNYQFYERQTLHKSSMSAGIHAAVAAQLDLTERAYHYFIVSANTDRNDVYGNTSTGIHAGALGATWQAAVSGFCGIRMFHENIMVSPALPSSWRTVKVTLYIKGILVYFTVSQDCVKIYAEPAKDLLWLTKQKHRKLVKQLCFNVYGNMHRINLNKEYEFKAPLKEEIYYDMEDLL